MWCHLSCDTLQQYRLANETNILIIAIKPIKSDTLQQYRLANETRNTIYFPTNFFSDTLQQYRLANETQTILCLLQYQQATLYNNIA